MKSRGEILGEFTIDNALLLPDPEHSTDEDRFILMGFSASLRILVVCHCYRRSEEVIRGVAGRSVVIRDLHAFRAVIVPNETYPELVVDSYGVFPLSVAFQCFQFIPRRNSKRIQADDGV